MIKEDKYSQYYLLKWKKRREGDKTLGEENDC